VIKRQLRIFASFKGCSLSIAELVVYSAIATKSKPGSRVTTESDRSPKRFNAQRMAVLGNRHRKYGEMTRDCGTEPGEKEGFGEGEGRGDRRSEDERLYQGWRMRERNPRRDRFVFKRFVKKSWTRFTLDYSPGAGVKSRNEMTIDTDGSEQVEIIGNG